MALTFTSDVTLSKMLTFHMPPFLYITASWDGGEEKNEFTFARCLQACLEHVSVVQVFVNAHKCSRSPTVM